MYEDTKGQPSCCSVCCCIICWRGVRISSPQGQQRCWKRVTVTQTNVPTYNVMMYQHHYMLFLFLFKNDWIGKCIFGENDPTFTRLTTFIWLNYKLYNVHFSTCNSYNTLISLGIFLLGRKLTNLRLARKCPWGSLCPNLAFKRVITLSFIQLQFPYDCQIFNSLL